MTWQQLFFTVEYEIAEEASEYLLCLGADAVTLQDAGNDDQFEEILGKTYYWPSTCCVALFDDQLDVNPIIQAVCDQFTTAVHSYRCELLKDEAWETRWMQYFKPMHFGHRLSVYPSWFEVPTDERVVLRLDPGMAFGTGTHATTRLMLEWLDAYLKETDTIVDYGCGSGILAIACEKLGANHIVATDNDANAIASTLSNAQLNHCHQLSAVASDAFQAHQNSFDVVLANILAQPLCDLAPLFAAILKPGGTCVLSGILKSQVDLIKSHYNDFIITDVATCDGWARVVANLKVH